jgi:hypothetical protein
LNSFSNEIIKNLFLNVNRQTEALTLVLSCVGGEGERAKFFKDTPHFYSLPQGERRDGRKNFKRPITLPSPAGCGCVVIWFLFENFID